MKPREGKATEEGIEFAHEWRAGDSIYLVNPEERPFLSHARHWKSEVGLYYLSFGAYACARLFVYARCLDDALETAAEWLKEHAPGSFVDDEHLAELYNDARVELAEQGLSDEELEERAHEQATEDLTYTESGYLPSWEWFADGPLTREQTLRLLDRESEADLQRRCDGMRRDPLRDRQARGRFAYVADHLPKKGRAA